MSCYEAIVLQVQQPSIDESSSGLSSYGRFHIENRLVYKIASEFMDPNLIDQLMIVLFPITSLYDSSLTKSEIQHQSTIHIVRVLIGHSWTFVDNNGIFNVALSSIQQNK
jgi:hypothetical protein